MFVIIQSGDVFGRFFEVTVLGLYVLHIFIYRGLICIHFPCRVLFIGRFYRFVTHNVSSPLIFVLCSLQKFTFSLQRLIQ